MVKVLDTEELESNVRDRACEDRLPTGFSATRKHSKDSNLNIAVPFHCYSIDYQLQRSLVELGSASERSRATQKNRTFGSWFKSFEMTSSFSRAFRPLVDGELVGLGDLLAPRGAWLRQKSFQEISCTVVALLVLEKCVSSGAL